VEDIFSKGSTNTASGRLAHFRFSLFEAVFPCRDIDKLRFFPAAEWIGDGQNLDFLKIASRGRIKPNFGSLMVKIEFLF